MKNTANISNKISNGIKCRANFFFFIRKRKRRGKRNNFNMTALFRFLVRTTQKDIFKKHAFNVILDTAINSLSDRFEQLESFNNS